MLLRMVSSTFYHLTTKVDCSFFWKWFITCWS